MILPAFHGLIPESLPDPGYSLPNQRRIRLFFRGRDQAGKPFHAFGRADAPVVACIQHSRAERMGAQTVGDSVFSEHGCRIVFPVPVNILQFGEKRFHFRRRFAVEQSEMFIDHGIGVQRRIVEDLRNHISGEHVAVQFTFQESAADPVTRHFRGDFSGVARIDPREKFVLVAGRGIPARTEQIEPDRKDFPALVFYPFFVDLIVLDPVEFRIPPGMDAEAHLNAQVVRQLHFFRIVKRPLICQRGNPDSRLFFRRGIGDIGDPLPHQVVFSDRLAPLRAFRTEARPLGILMLDRGEKRFPFQPFLVTSVGRQTDHRHSVPLFHRLIRKEFHDFRLGKTDPRRTIRIVRILPAEESVQRHHFPFITLGEILFPPLLEQGGVFLFSGFAPVMEIDTVDIMIGLTEE